MLDNIALRKAAIAAGPGLATAQVYKWVDKDGKVRYGDVAPPGIKAVPLKPPPGGAAAASTTANPAAADKADKSGPLTPAQQEQAYRERQLKAKEAQEKAEQERVVAEQRARNCGSAQESLRAMETGRRLASVNAQGETVYLDESQVQERIARARQVVAESCK